MKGLAVDGPGPPGRPCRPRRGGPRHGPSSHRRLFALTELLLGSFFALFGACALTAGALFLYNSRFDAGPMVTHTTTILSKPRGGDTRVVPWDHARSWQKVGMSHAVYVSTKVGDSLEVDVHPGALGWPWVSDVRKAGEPVVASPPTLSAPSASATASP